MLFSINARVTAFSGSTRKPACMTPRRYRSQSYTSIGGQRALRVVSAYGREFIMVRSQFRALLSTGIAEKV